MNRIVFGMLAVCTSVSAAQAPLASKQTLTLDGARRVVASAEDYAKAHNTTGVIAVVDDGGNLMAVERIDGTFSAGANISIGKARTAVLFKKPTKVFEDIIKNGRTAMVALNDFTPLQGGIPIVVDGQLVGGVGVSGAASAQQDEELAIAGAAAIGTVSMASNGSLATLAPVVQYWPRKDVDASFARGAVLFDGNQGAQNYMVHTSRRATPGMAEVHTRDTDIIYVLSGSATFVTGGAVLDGKTTAPDEIRGASIANGDTRKISKGDVIIIPNGTPHWFQQVSGPISYYTIKVR